MPGRLSPHTRKLLVICLASAGWSFGFGLGAPLASLWLRDEGHSWDVIGLNTAVYYLGIALAAALVPAMMRRWGNGCPVRGMIFSGAAVALFPLGGSLANWFVLRVLNGVFGAMSLIPMETYVNRDLEPEQRARNFGFYAFSVASGWALGNLFGLQLYPVAPFWAFGLGGAVSVAAGALVLVAMPPAGAPAEERHDGPVPAASAFLSWGSAWCQGFLEGGMVGLLPVYLLSIGLTEQGVSWLTSGIMIGVILFQLPVAWLADRVNRTGVLAGCYLVTAVGLAFLPGCGVSAWLAVWLFLVGACSGSFYPLGLAVLGNRVPPSGLPRASAWYLAINCVGSLTGPAITGAVMSRFGKRSMFLSGEAALLLVVALWAATGWHRLRRRQVGAPSGPNGFRLETHNAA